MNAKQRLASYRQQAEAWNAKVPGAPRTWKIFAHGRAGYRHGGTWDSKSLRYYVDRLPAWRDCGTAQEVSPRTVGHNGWYVDEFQDETVSGHVLQLPSRGGVPQYVPAIVWSDQDGVTLFPLDRYAEPLEAARAADQYAESTAEQEREWREASNARMQWDDKADEIARMKADRKGWRAELATMKGHRTPGFKTARRRLREVIAESLEASAELAKERDELESRFSDQEGWKNA